MVRDRALTLLMAMFLVFLAAQLVTGLYEYNATQREHGKPLVTMSGYMATGHPWEAIFENWESEFLQMAVFVLLTTWPYRRAHRNRDDRARRNSWTPIRVTSPMTLRPRGRLGEAAGSCGSMSIRWGS